MQIGKQPNCFGFLSLWPTLALKNFSKETALFYGKDSVLKNQHFQMEEKNYQKFLKITVFEAKSSLCVQFLNDKDLLSNFSTYYMFWSLL